MTGKNHAFASRGLPLAGLLLLAACARSEDASVVADTNELQVEQVRTPERDGADIAIGDWRDTLQGDSRALEFGPDGAPPLFSLRCDERGAVLLQRHGTLPAGDLPMMLVSVGSETRRLAVTNVGGAVPMLRASLAPSDTLVTTLTGTTAPVNIRIGDSPPLVLPPSLAVGQFLDGCEGGAGGDPTPAPEGAGDEAPADGNAAAPSPPPAQR